MIEREPVGFYVYPAFGRFGGWGPTPGLALRSFWRECERRVLAGERPDGFEYLPNRRQNALYRRANHGAA